MESNNLNNSAIPNNSANPAVLDPDTIKSNVLRLQNANASPEDIDSYVKSATQESQAAQPQANKSIGGFFSNFASDIPNTISDVVGGTANLASHPIESAENIYQSAKSGNLLNQFAGGLLKGDIKGFGNALYNRPLSTAVDIGSVAEPFLKVGGLGEVAKIANPLIKGTEVGGKVLESLGAEKSIAPFAKSYLPETAKSFTEERIKPPISAITKSRFLQQGEAVASKTLFGQGIINDVNNAKNLLSKKTSDILGRITPDINLSQESLGKNIQQGFREYQNTFKQTQNKIYDAFLSTSAKLPATTENTTKALEDIISQKQLSATNTAEANFYQKIADKVSGNTPELAKAGISPEIAKQIGYQGANFNFENLKATRTDIGEMIAKDPTNGNLRKLYGALSDDMENTVKNSDKNLGNQLNTINEGYKTGINKIESKLSMSIQKSSPEKIASNLFKKNSADTQKLLKEMIGPEKYSDLSKTYLADTLKKSTVRGEFDVNKLKSNLSKLDKDTLNEIFTPQQRKTLNGAMDALGKNQKLQEAIKTGTKVSEGSQTAFLNRTTQLPLETGAFLTALATGHFGLAAGIISDLGLEYSGTKLFTSDLGRKFLTEGLKIPENKTLTRVGGFAKNQATPIGRGASLGRFNKQRNNPGEE